MEWAKFPAKRLNHTNKVRSFPPILAPILVLTPSKQGAHVLGELLTVGGSCGKIVAMGKLRDLRLHASRLIRDQLPLHVVEAESVGSTLWCTATASVFLQHRNRSLQVFTMTPRLDAYARPAETFGTEATAEAIAGAVLRGLAAPAVPEIPAGASTTATMCGASMRRGIDIAIMATQQRIESFHYDLRDGIGPLADADTDPEEWAVGEYLLYLSLLVDQAQSGLAMLVNHGQDVGAMLQQRILVEYAARAHYALRHRDHTLWAMTIGEAEDRLRRLVAAGAEQPELDKARAERDYALATYPVLAAAGRARNWKGLQFRTIFEEVASPEQHVSLYKFPSMFIHADPIGRHVVFRSNDEGLREGIIHLPDIELNSNLVDATAMLIEFLRALIEAFPTLRSSAESTAKLNLLERENWIHMLRFPNDRRPEFLERARTEFGVTFEDPSP